MIKAEKLYDAGIDYKSGIERFMNDESFYEEVLRAFINENISESAECAYASGDKASLEKIVHSMKGSSGNAGLDGLYEKSFSLLSLLRSDECDDNKLKEAYGDFSAEYRKVHDGISAALC